MAEVPPVIIMAVLVMAFPKYHSVIIIFPIHFAVVVAAEVLMIPLAVMVAITETMVVKAEPLAKRGWADIMAVTEGLEETER